MIFNCWIFYQVYYRFISRCLRLLCNAGAEWIQIDEPFLVMDLEPDVKNKFIDVYKQISNVSERPNILLTTYFGGLGENESLVLSLPGRSVFTLILCVIRCNWIIYLDNISSDMVLSLGVVNGRNIWRNDFTETLKLVNKAKSKLGNNRIWIAPSCSLVTRSSRYWILKQIWTRMYRHGWRLRKQKLEEISTLTQIVNHGIDNDA